MQKHEILKKYIVGLTKGYNHALIVCGKAGIGKTETTLKQLNELGYTEGTHYLYLTNYITPVELYQLLQEVNQLQEPKILVLDDIEETLKNSRIVGILRSALWEANGKRKVCWASSTYKIQEKSFNFEGRIIFLLNKIDNKNPLIAALKDRALFYEMELTPSEIVALIKERAEMEFHNISLQQRRKIADFLIKLNQNNPAFTLRILPKAYQLYLLSPNSYQFLIKELIK
jgi:hypothetical protein